MKQVFVDTSGWIALVNKTDSLHLQATDVYQKLFIEGHTFITHQGVMLEVGNGLSAVNNRPRVIGLRKNLKSRTGTNWSRSAASYTNLVGLYSNSGKTRTGELLTA